MRYKEQKDGVWVQPVVTEYKMQCCDCGLVHKIDFRISDEGRIQFRATRDNRATAQIRRHTKPTSITSK